MVVLGPAQRTPKRSQGWHHTPVIPALARLRREEQCDSEANLGSAQESSEAWRPGQHRQARPPDTPCHARPLRASSGPAGSYFRAPPGPGRQAPPGRRDKQAPGRGRAPSQDAGEERMCPGWPGRRVGERPGRVPSTAPSRAPVGHCLPAWAGTDETAKATRPPSPAGSGPGWEGAGDSRPRAPPRVLQALGLSDRAAGSSARGWGASLQGTLALSKGNKRIWEAEAPRTPAAFGATRPSPRETIPPLTPSCQELENDTTTLIQKHWGAPVSTQLHTSKPHSKAGRDLTSAFPARPSGSPGASGPCAPSPSSGSTPELSLSPKGPFLASPQVPAAPPCLARIKDFLPHPPAHLQLRPRRRRGKVAAASARSPPGPLVPSGVRARLTGEEGSRPDPETHAARAPLLPAGRRALALKPRAPGAGRGGRAGTQHTPPPRARTPV
nr:uncharacterized protein LOC111756318 [Cavia porcellus]